MDQDKTEPTKKNLKKENFKKSYTKPELTVHGDLDAITKSGGYTPPSDGIMAYPP